MKYKAVIKISVVYKNVEICSEWNRRVNSYWNEQVEYLGTNAEVII